MVLAVFTTRRHSKRSHTSILNHLRVASRNSRSSALCSVHAVSAAVFQEGFPEDLPPRHGAAIYSSKMSVKAKRTFVDYWQSVNQIMVIFGVVSLR